MGAKGVLQEVKNAEEKYKTIQTLNNALIAGRIQEAKEIAKIADYKYGTDYLKQIESEEKRQSYAKDISEKIATFVEQGQYDKAEKGINILQGMGYITKEEAEKVKLKVIF
jgi:hypothetical protein